MSEAHAPLVAALADDALIYAQRLGEWISRAPQIEEDMALGNIALDLLGRARSLYGLLGALDGTGRGEDDYAYWRDEREFLHVHLVEQPRQDFGFVIERYAALASSADVELAGVASKAVTESRYHRDHARLWTLRLGDGTDESHRRMVSALERVAPYVEELFEDTAVETAAVEAGVGVLPSTLRPAAMRFVEDTLAEATLEGVPSSRWRSRGGREGLHSEACGYLLAEMQQLARSHPGATW